MNYLKSILGFALLASLGAAGCGGGDDTPPLVEGTPIVLPDGTMAEGPAGQRTYVFSYLNIGQADPAGDPGVVPGFNLDGRVSDDADPTGCFHEDFTSPPPDNETGVDNQLGPILASVGMSLDIEGTIAGNIQDGTLLILVTVDGINSFTNDSDVTVNIELGTLQGTDKTMPDVDAMGNLTADQSLNVNMASVGQVQLDGQITNGRLNAGPGDLTLNLPVMGMELSLHIQAAQIRFDISDTSIDTGILGGSLNVDETVSAVVMLAPDSIPESLARSILEGQADLEPDAMGDCQSVSVGLVFDGPRIVRGDEVAVP